MKNISKKEILNRISKLNLDENTKVYCWLIQVVEGKKTFIFDFSDLSFVATNSLGIKIILFRKLLTELDIHFKFVQNESTATGLIDYLIIKDDFI